MKDMSMNNDGDKMMMQHMRDLMSWPKSSQMAVKEQMALYGKCNLNKP
jgi:hypothetical protein